MTDISLFDSGVREILSELWYEIIIHHHEMGELNNANGALRSGRNIF